MTKCSNCILLTGQIQHEHIRVENLLRMMDNTAKQAKYEANITNRHLKEELRQREGHLRHIKHLEEKCRHQRETIKRMNARINELKEAKE